ncbi:MAG TPA: YitT family protein [Isosphaeraceae bacterium]|nr:YitT family protein [Isosphaeraceae bacterium]
MPSSGLPVIFYFMKQLLRELSNALFIILGILSAGMGIHGFLISSHFIDGGVTGISMLLANVLGIPLPILILAINLPFIGLGYRQIGRAFAIRSALAISGLSVCLATIHYPDVTPDKLLTAVFGGFFIGAGMGLAMRGGAVLDGTDIAALLISKRSHLFRVGDVILGLNVLIFLTAEFFLGVEPALYSILTYLSATKTLDFLLHGLEEYTAITIVSERSAAIREALTVGLGRGVTVYKGRGGMSGADQEILLCVVTRLEIGKVLNIAHDLDDSSFITIHPLAEVKGGVLKKTAHH